MFRKSKIIISLLIISLTVFASAAYAVTSLVLINERAGFFKINGAGKSPYNILLLGSDSRDSSFKGRSDAIIVLRINPGQGSIKMVSFPRDSRVSIPGRGNTKINAAFAYGDAELAVKTIEQFAGIKIDNYIVTNFQGFIKIIDQLGGLDITLDKPIHDRFAGPFLAAGTQKRNGLEALALARSRKALPRGDFDRAANQQKIITSLFMQQKDLTIRGLIKTIAFVAPHTKTDISFSRAIKIAMSFNKIDPSRIKGEVLNGSSGSGSMIILDRGQASRTFENFR